MQNTETWPIACASYASNLDNHYPPNRLIQFCKLHAFVFPHVISKTPSDNALLVFTDGSSTGTAAYTFADTTVKFKTSHISVQLVELQALITVLLAFPDQALNIYADSAYLAHSIPLLETVAQIKHVSDTAKLFLQCIIEQHPSFLDTLELIQDYQDLYPRATNWLTWQPRW